MAIPHKEGYKGGGQTAAILKTRHISIQCRLHVGPASATLAQHEGDIGKTFLVCTDVARLSLP